MRILESWEDRYGRVYAIVLRPERDQVEFGCRPFVAMWELDDELFDFGGGPGHGIADFNSLDETRDFLLAGIERQEEQPEVWLEMVEVASGIRS